MAKTAKPAIEEEGEISFSMIKFTMKGSDASLQKGIDTIKAAFAAQGFAAVPEARQIRTPSPARQLPSAEADESVEVDAHEVEDATELEDDGPAVAPAPRKASTQRKPPNFKIIRDLKFDDVSPTLAEFVADKKPDTHLDRYLCIAHWFKHHKDSEDLTVEHFFTAYMHYSWTLPTNEATPVRDLRHQKRQWFLAGSVQGTSTIANSGERRVMEMGKGEA